MPRDLLTIRCPEDVKEAIEQIMTESGRSKTEVVVELLRQALSLETPIRYTATLDDERSVLYQQLLDEMDQRLEPIVLKLMELESALGE